MPELKQFERLPNEVCPKHYKLNLQPNLEKCSFRGCVEIEIEVRKAVSYILLNSADLEVSDITLVQNGRTLEPAKTEFFPKEETLKISFSEKIETCCNSILKISFQGLLQDNMKGFYRSKYTVDNQDRYAAVTQFESTDARRCFPCWDEPAWKATFDITVTAPNNRVVLSNMQEIARKAHDTDGSLDIVTFALSPIMSTYLVAIVVGEFDYIENVLDNKIVVRVYTPLGRKDHGIFALEVASKALPYYHEYFDIAYPLPKMDLIAISDFAVGAMENWGLVTYRETCLLVDPLNTSAIRKQIVAKVVAHELAHQWFGNLVTMEWWTHLWLNEGYASFCESFITSHLYPKMNVWAQFQTNTFIGALELDALKSSHPIQVTVGHPSEVDEIFDEISYNKGASAIRMIHSYIGDKDFRSGMHTYLDRHKYKNTVTEDLWKALEEASGKPIEAVMSTWTEQTGFPMLTVTSQQDGPNRIINISQKRFLADGSTDGSSLWMVPVNIVTANDASKSVKDFILDSKSSSLVLENVSVESWVKLNMGSVGYYRTKYSSEMLSQLIPAISTKILGPPDRLNILDDLFAMVPAGHSSTVDFLTLLRAFEDENEYTVWSALSNCLGQLDQLISSTNYQDLFHSFARKLFSKIFASVGWDAKLKEGHLDTILRMLVLGSLGKYREPSVIEEAKKRLAAHIAGTATIPADIRGAVYNTVMRQNCETTFQQMLNFYKDTETSEERNRIAMSLGASSDPNLIQRTLQFAMSTEVRNQDTIFVIVSVARSHSGRLAAWSFFKTHLKEFKKRLEGLSLLPRLIKGITENFASLEIADEIETFFKDSEPLAGIERALQQSLECIRLNAAWLERDSSSIEKYLQQLNH